MILKKIYSVLILILSAFSLRKCQEIEGLTSHTRYLLQEVIIKYTKDNEILSSECQNDLNAIKQGLTDHKIWALKGDSVISSDYSNIYLYGF